MQRRDPPAAQAPAGTTEGQEASLPAQTRDLLHELRVHQAELEMQNEELRRTQAELDAARARYFDLYNLAPVGYLTLNEAGVVDEANLTAAELLGTTRSALIGQPITAFVSGESQDTLYLQRKRLSETGAPQSFDLRLLRSGATTFWARLETTAALGKDGTASCAVMLSDVTDRRRAEEILHGAEKIEAIGLLAGGIAHDFNNLLGALFPFLEIADADLRAGDIAGVRQNLSQAMTSLERARGLTGQLLTFARGGEPVRRLQPLDRLIRETVQFVLSGSRLLPVFGIPAGLWPAAFDAGQIAQAIDNLVINARQASPRGGRLEVSADNVPASTAPSFLGQADYVRISIRDHGVGIPREKLSLVFDPFFTTKEKGSGLGLATAYSIVRRHGGLIRADSEPGSGTTFEIYLPAQPTGEVETPSARPEATDFRGEGRVLLMDDEEAILEAISSSLELLGFEAVTARNGDEALRAVAGLLGRGESLVAAILDLTVPGGRGGSDVLPELAALVPGLPVIASSGYSDDPVLARPASFGFAAALAKPYQLAQLAGVLATLLAH